MSVLLALVAAACYGVSDFAGGLASRRTPVLAVLTITYPVGTALVCAAAPLIGGEVSSRTLAWSAVGGVIGLAGVGLLYAALASAPMNIVSPITGVLSAAVPVLAGVLLGERPTVLGWCGIVLAVIAVVLVSRQPEDHPHGPVGLRPVAYAIGAGAGFGGFFICLARTATDSGLWPVAIARLAATATVVCLALAFGGITRMAAASLGAALVAAVLDAGANIAFLLAAREGLLSLASVITALYPAGTVLLAMVFLKEHLVSVQRYGLALATVSVVLVTR